MVPLKFHFVVDGDYEYDCECDFENNQASVIWWSEREQRMISRDDYTIEEVQGFIETHRWIVTDVVCPEDDIVFDMDSIL